MNNINIRDPRNIINLNYIKIYIYYMKYLSIYIFLFLSPRSRDPIIKEPRNTFYLNITKSQIYFHESPHKDTT